MSANLKKATLPKILIVDDLEANRFALKTILKPLQAELDLVGSGEEAVSSVLRNEYALILLDVQMPNLDGYETAGLIRGNKDSSQTPIIFITANSKDERSAHNGYEMGAVDYIFKPIDETILFSKVSVFLNLYKQKKEIEAMNEKLLESNTLLRDFAFTVSHDLKSPMRRISSYCDLLKKKLGDNLDESGQKYIETIEHDIDFSLQLMSDLLEYANHKSSSPKELVDISLNDALKRARDNLEVNIKESGAHIEIGELPPIKGDEIALIRLFQNIMANAIKFNDTGTPTVKVESLSIESGMACIAISDNGIGIREKNLESIFSPFKRLHNQSKYPGSGIGLATCKSIVEKHEGDIWAKSEEGKGTTFYITFPLLQAKAA